MFGLDTIDFFFVLQNKLIIDLVAGVGVLGLAGHLGARGALLSVHTAHMMLGIFNNVYSY